MVRVPVRGAHSRVLEDQIQDCEVKMAGIFRYCGVEIPMDDTRIIEQVGRIVKVMTDELECSKKESGNDLPYPPMD